MNLPDKQLLRRGEAMGWLGIGKDAFGKLVKEKVLTVVRVNGQGRAFFRRSEVLQVGNADVSKRVENTQTSQDPMTKGK